MSETNEKRKVRIEELFLMNGRTAKILARIRDETKNGTRAVRLKFNDVAEEMNISRHCVAYNFGKLLRRGYITVEGEGKNKTVNLNVELPETFRFGQTG